MIYAATCDCPNGHNIAVMPFELPHQPTNAESEDHCRQLYRILKKEIAAGGEMKDDCPFCGARINDWNMSVRQMKVDTMAEALALSKADDREGTEAARKARRRRAN